LRISASQLVWRVVHHLLGVEIVAGAAAFDHVAGEGEWRSAETDDGNFFCEMFRYETHGLGDIAKFGGAVGAELCDVFGSADRLLDDRAFSRGKMKGQAHDFEREQEVGEDDGCIDAEKLGGGDGDFGGEGGHLADFEEGMLLANGAIFGHVASSLTHEPDGSVVGGLRFAGAKEAGIGSGHGRYDGPTTLAFLQGGVRAARGVCARLWI
jgi:hypothetical protein